MKVNRKFKVLSKYGMLKRNMAYTLIGYMKENAITNTGKSLNTLFSSYTDDDKERYRQQAIEFSNKFKSDKSKSLMSFMSSQVHRIVIKRETDTVMDRLLYFVIRRYMGKRYSDIRFTQRLFNRLESGKYPLHRRLIKSKNYHSNGKGV